MSGTTFDRPGLNAMISEIRAGKINLVIVKALSRFGRDYIEIFKNVMNDFYACVMRCATRQNTTNGRMEPPQPTVLMCASSIP